MIRESFTDATIPDQPRLLDLFCCSGGATVGYQRAGFHVTGVDIAPQPNYAGDVFIQGDAIEYARECAHQFNAVSASPPCQNQSALTRGNRKRAGWADTHVNLIPEVRLALTKARDASIPTVIENVQGSNLRRDLILCGLTFGLKVFRHRYFETTGFTPIQPAHQSHAGHRVAGWRHGVRYEGNMVAVYGDGGGKGSVADWQAAMGIDWTADKRELAEAIPPDYTHLIGSQIMAQIGERKTE